MLRLLQRLHLDVKSQDGDIQAWPTPPRQGTGCGPLLARETAGKMSTGEKRTHGHPQDPRSPLRRRSGQLGGGPGTPGPRRRGLPEFKAHRVSHSHLGQRLPQPEQDPETCFLAEVRKVLHAMTNTDPATVPSGPPVLNEQEMGM